MPDVMSHHALRGGHAFGITPQLDNLFDGGRVGWEDDQDELGAVAPVLIDYTSTDGLESLNACERHIASEQEKRM